MSNMNRQFLLAARPSGMVQESDFEYTEVPKPIPGPNEILVQTTHISLDPSMRGQMENRADYVAPLNIGDVMRAGGVGRVVESNHPDFAVGDMVGGTFGMQDYVVFEGSAALRRYPENTSAEQALGVLGGTGMTAYFGLLDIGEPKAGDVVVISGAAGATGSIAGQIARIKGCTVIGIAGSDAKCDWLTNELGFNFAINYKTQNIADALDKLAPDGINIYFDNVGGEILDIALERIATNARVVICGGISRYNATGELAGPKNYFNLVYRRARMEGFIVLDYADQFPAAAEVMRGWLNSGELKQGTTVVNGFSKLPETLVALFAGVNTGKLMVKTS